MSYEGYYVALCANGHKRAWDCWDHTALDAGCDCGARFVWQKGIDQTNGCEETCDRSAWSFCHEGPWPEKMPAKTEVCNLGHTHVIVEETYQIPEIP